MFRVVRFRLDDAGHTVNGGATDAAALLTDARRIRTTVFCGEQRVPPDIEWDGQDPDCDHFLLLEDDTPIGAARLRAYHGLAKAERVAVLKEHRGRKAGWLLMEALIAHAKETGFSVMMLNAQVAVEGFYTAMGFAADGPHFVEADIEHVRMARAL